MGIWHIINCWLHPNFFFITTTTVIIIFTLMDEYNLVFKYQMMWEVFTLSTGFTEKVG